jgi:hypothetical protein
MTQRRRLSRQSAAKRRDGGPTCSPAPVQGQHEPKQNRQETCQREKLPGPEDNRHEGSR